MIRLLKNRKGSSMVSSIAAFAILIIGLGIFTTSITASFNSINQATKIKKDIDKSMENYYLEDGSGDDVLVNSDGKIYFKDGNDNGFTVDGKLYEQKITDFPVYYFSEE